MSLVRRVSRRRPSAPPATAPPCPPPSQGICRRSPFLISGRPLYGRRSRATRPPSTRRAAARCRAVRRRTPSRRSPYPYATAPPTPRDCAQATVAARRGFAVSRRLPAPARQVYCRRAPRPSRPPTAPRPPTGSRRTLPASGGVRVRAIAPPPVRRVPGNPASGRGGRPPATVSAYSRAVAPCRRNRRS